MTHDKDKDDNKPKPLHDYWMIEEDEIEKDILKHKKKEDNKDDKP